MFAIVEGCKNFLFFKNFTFHFSLSKLKLKLIIFQINLLLKSIINFNTAKRDSYHLNIIFILIRIVLIFLELKFLKYILYKHTKNSPITY